MPAPAIPQQLTAQQGNAQVLITWQPVYGVDNYTVQRSTDNSTFSTVSSPTEPSYLDTDVTVGTTYYYRVSATNGFGPSSYTASVNIVPTTSGSMTLGQIRLAAQQRADRVNSNFVTMPEWNSYINQSYFELYDILVQAYGNEYYVAPITVFTTTGASSYTLPDGLTVFQDADGADFTPPPFYKLLGVDLGLNPGANAWITLKRYEFISRNRFVYPQITTSLLGVAGLRYRIIGNRLHFIPTPQGNQQVRLWYVPRMTELLQDADTCDAVSGWTEYLIVDAAIKALQKEESDVSVLMAQKQALIDRIQAAAENRDAGEPATISDTRRATDLWGSGFPGDGQGGGY
jgi:hypothetical protein